MLTFRLLVWQKQKLHEVKFHFARILVACEVLIFNTVRDSAIKCKGVIAPHNFYAF